MSQLASIVKLYTLNMRKILIRIIRGRSLLLLNNDRTRERLTLQSHVSEEILHERSKMHDDDVCPFR